MKKTTITYECYQYDELDEEAKEKALEGMYSLNVDYDWYDYEHDTFNGTGIETDTRGLSFDIDRGSYLHFSDFNYTKKTEEGKEIHGTHKGIWIEQQDKLAQALAADKVIDRKTMHAIERGDLYLSIGITHYGGGDAKNVLGIEAGSDEGYELMDKLEGKTHDAIEGWLTDKLETLLSDLRKEYEYATSREAIEETIRANEYEFSKEGKFPCY